uniref:ribonuclease H n=1 Tax=Phallusia mammillata TaxID=59560 RepID=A0A6F9DQ98_9ASCI|nr:ribonuclease H1-like [Phallusia mammillata]
MLLRILSVPTNIYVHCLKHIRHHQTVASGFTNAQHFEEFKVHQHVKDTLSAVDGHDFEFTRDNLNRVVVYTDGCCLNNNLVVDPRRQAGIGVFWGKKHPLNMAIPIKEKHLTSNRSEILAAHTAVVFAKQLNLQTLCLHSDSLYVINSCNEWLLKWKTNTWLTKKGVKVKNLDLWKSFAVDLRAVFTTFQKVDETDECLKCAHDLANLGARK